MAKNRLKVLKHLYPIFQKNPVHRSLKNLTFWPFLGSRREFQHFHDRWSGAQTIHFKVFNPTAKL